MTHVDLAIIAITAALAIAGFLSGFVVSALSLVGLGLGALVGTRLAPLLLPGGAANPYTPVFGLAGALATATLLASVFQNLGVALRRVVFFGPLAIVDRVLGAVLAAAVALGVTWIMAAVLMASPQTRFARPYIRTSTIVAQLNRMLPPSGALLNTLAATDPLRTLRGPLITGAPPDPLLPRDPQIRAASRSVVRVQGDACGFRITGSGWVGAAGLVVTNAHVVAGEHDTQVEVGGDAHGARVVHFDPVSDVAVLAVDGVGRPPLRMESAPVPGAGGAVLGYPENGPFRATAARYLGEQPARSNDIYGHAAERLITLFRGVVRPGNSGGPFVDGAGRVVTTVFASQVGSPVPGGYGVPNSIVQTALADAQARHAVGTGACAP